MSSSNIGKEETKMLQECAQHVLNGAFYISEAEALAGYVINTLSTLDAAVAAFIKANDGASMGDEEDAIDALKALHARFLADVAKGTES